MDVLALLTILLVSPSVFCLPPPKSYASDNLSILTREQWGGRPPVNIIDLNLPVPFVVIHHTYIPGVCFTIPDCSASMRGMQNFHQLDLGWDDIGYNFAIGGDGTVFEGRGWDAVGAHSFGVNSRSIGIALIGDWVSQRPPQVQLDAAKSLIQEGVRLGYISDDYDLIGHRQVTPTECPGQALFDEMSAWERFQSNF